jgi:hypothetical protein
LFEFCAQTGSYEIYTCCKNTLIISHFRKCLLQTLGICNFSILGDTAHAVRQTFSSNGGNKKYVEDYDGEVY